ncbi:ARF GAP-like zinc finger-containing protein [Histomonas meleagridis]|uniref:ARF GAP-like zinc finger-containing protein n=1 Tax=Histomonas meleagridis TaxID=135588 RepID=UPI00355AC3A3|nr:ARF GAP-like zinc finger-containing protein [Histomonas meleagridis]KAH0806224.1 ARF GAP-like zinc finger-containing protein [Histomonas meleagridis]
MKPSKLSDESLQYMQTQAFFNIEQQKRYEYLQQIGSELTTISQHFTLYADLGQKMCEEFKQLRNSFDNMEIIATDQSIKPLSEIFQAVDTAFTTHFNIISKSIADPLNQFVAQDLIKLATLEKDYQKHHSSYIEAEERYASMKSSAKGKEKNEKEQAMVQEHTLSSLSFFEFCMNMEGIELKLKSLLPQMFMSYLTSVSEPFAECLKQINNREGELNETKATIDEVNSQLQKFSKHSVQVKQEVSSQIPLYWERLTAPYEATLDTSIQGFLRKRQGLTKSWHKLFFVISNGILSYSKNVEGVFKTTKNIPLMNCTVKRESNLGRNNCFSISTHKKTIVLQALTMWEMYNWMTVIQNSIYQELNKGAIEIEENVSNLQTEIKCADCGAPNATWCSLNWGVTLCPKCVAEHRSLGPKISRVRSTHLDTIDPYQHALIEAIGNDVANSVLEAKVGNDKIGPNAIVYDRHNYIVRKYQNLEFIDDNNRNNNINIFKSIQRQDIISVFKYICTQKLNKFDSNKFAPIHAAAIVGNPIVLSLVAFHTNDVDQLDDIGWSALSYATYYGATIIVNELLSFGADPNSSEVAHPYCIAKFLDNQKLIKKFAKYEKNANYNEEMVFAPAHDEIFPKRFKFKKFVSDPSVYKENKQQMSPKQMTEQDQEKLSSAILNMRTKLSKNDK